MQKRASGTPIDSSASLRREIRFGLPDSSSVSRTRQILGRGTP